ncbi:GNAT family N-acetyltransferase [Actinoplanes sp. NPDC051494]|uniref:GNAT family N-acetyltransferase n=1 Tax=Actinoplanes sp. NPDC051494 TaxID=3363907 RepID=UPI0037BDDB76
MEPLDNPAWAALSGPQASFARRYGRSARYDPAVSPFAAVQDPADPAAWDDLRAVVDVGDRVIVTAPGLTVPPGWTGEAGIPGVQLVGHDYHGAPEPEAEPLGPADVADMLDLVARTRPGPFREGTVELGDYVGIRRDGALVAMAGVRMRPPGYAEISAVCTDPAFRGAGLATRLIAAVSAAIRARGEVPYLHAAETNTGAIRLYRNLGFTVRRTTSFVMVAPA